ncbi:sugar transferase [Photobacterium sp. 2_MG-2023]|uniref:sugar transferase n=1 Tax=Photobacterium sp. 2_MG-2023 TaxID=3062663 RepID=UPI0026E3981F|nr:sugar transferase [Photobacterium sp. 2_MG-2023]MDO6579743.1 sugar transferase [Photobacterium sp. 2_MG-2023]
MKRLFDITLSAILILLLLPIFILILIFLCFNGRQPIFKQERVGINGKIFFLYKFRSMVINAHSLGGYSTRSNDTRITPIGFILRKTSIDELPQLFNVLKGEMSLVGPRPNVPAQIKDYTDDDWTKRNSVLPGITGLAQAKLRSQATFDERLSLDFEYIEKQSFLFDLYILALTAKRLFTVKGN